MAFHIVFSSVRGLKMDEAITQEQRKLLMLVRRLAKQEPAANFDRAYAQLLSAWSAAGYDPKLIPSRPSRIVRSLWPQRRARFWTLTERWVLKRIAEEKQLPPPTYEDSAEQESVIPAAPAPAEMEEVEDSSDDIPLYHGQGGGGGGEGGGGDDYEPTYLDDDRPTIGALKESWENDFEGNAEARGLEDAFQTLFRASYFDGDDLKPTYNHLAFSIRHWAEEHLGGPYQMRLKAADLEMVRKMFAVVDLLYGNPALYNPDLRALRNKYGPDYVPFGTPQPPKKPKEKKKRDKGEGGAPPKPKKLYKTGDDTWKTWFDKYVIKGVQLNSKELTNGWGYIRTAIKNEKNELPSGEYLPALAKISNTYQRIVMALKMVNKVKHFGWVFPGDLYEPLPQEEEDEVEVVAPAKPQPPVQPTVIVIPDEDEEEEDEEQPQAMHISPYKATQKEEESERLPLLDPQQAQQERVRSLTEKLRRATDLHTEVMKFLNVDYAELLRAYGKIPKLMEGALEKAHEILNDWAAQWLEFSGRPIVDPLETKSWVDQGPVQLRALSDELNDARKELEQFNAHLRPLVQALESENLEEIAKLWPKIIEHITELQPKHRADVHRWTVTIQDFLAHRAEISALEAKLKDKQDELKTLMGKTPVERADDIERNLQQARPVVEFPRPKAPAAVPREKREREEQDAVVVQPAPDDDAVVVDTGVFYAALRSAFMDTLKHVRKDMPKPTLGDLKATLGVPLRAWLGKLTKNPNMTRLKRIELAPQDLAARRRGETANAIDFYFGTNRDSTPHVIEFFERLNKRWNASVASGAVKGGESAAKKMNEVIVM